MALSHAPLWTLDELSAQVALALAVDGPAQASGRVREVPDMRTIRYYTTLGLIDRPAQMRGRTALYGQRHLLQLVAIKRLQARGLALAEIQSRVVGKTNAVLRELSQLRLAPQSMEQPSEREERRNSGFWGASPADVPADETSTEQTETVQKNRGRAVLPLVSVALDDGVRLLLEGARSLDDHDVEALQAAAAPLLKLLKARRVLDAERAASSGQPQGDSP
ncbi:MAG TPA: MerR family transcriptional regulator [Gemmataceae bacterium]|nr:MerR family transcriptional regulator [Gemmataceae bacterium]